MNQDISELILMHKHDLRKSEHKIAEYVLNHLPDAAELTISQLADACEVSEATVNRFVKAIGLEGYGNFRITAAKSRFYNVPNSIEFDDSPGQIAAKLFASTTYAMRETHKNILEKDIDKAADLLNKANKISVIALGGSLSIAIAMNCLFAKAGFNIAATSDLYMDYTYISQMSNEDVIVIISMSGVSTPLCKLAVLAKEKNIPIIAITNSKSNPIAEISDVVLNTFTTEEAFYGDLIDGKFSQYFVVGVLYITTILKNYNKVEKNLKETGEAVKCYLTENNYQDYNIPGKIKY